VLTELQEAGAEAVFIAASLGEERHAADLIAAVTVRFGGIDVVVNNAGSSTTYSDIHAEDGPGERLRKVMRINLDAAYHVAAHALPVLRAGGCDAGAPGRVSRITGGFVTGQTLIVDGGLTITDYPSAPWLEAEGAWRLFPHMRPE
jgi:NAD(P)-dependent dehydrogenase (short-subunit alcohol dehydrogenase family)